MSIHATRLHCHKLILQGRSLQAGADLNVSTGRPLWGCLTKARGVSSTRMVRFRSLPRRDRSCSQDRLRQQQANTAWLHICLCKLHAGITAMQGACSVWQARTLMQG